MKNKELYRQKKQGELDKWKAEVDKLKAKASIASADAQIEMNNHVNSLKKRIKENKTKLSKLADAGEEVWDEIKEGIETSWKTMRSALKEATAKFKG